MLSISVSFQGNLAESLAGRPNADVSSDAPLAMEFISSIVGEYLFINTVQSSKAIMLVLSKLLGAKKSLCITFCW